MRQREGSGRGRPPLRDSILLTRSHSVAKKGGRLTGGRAGGETFQCSSRISPERKAVSRFSGMSSRERDHVNSAAVSSFLKYDEEDSEPRSAAGRRRQRGNGSTSSS